MVALACLMFHAASLLHVKTCIPGFSIRDYFWRYWVKAYPLLWATSSESLATPLNLSLVRKIYSDQIPPVLRRFVVGIGSWLNINGTLMCVIVLAGAIASMVGHEVSLVELLLTIPVIFLLGYGVPGIPGELILFAGPVAMLLGVPPETHAMFITLYIGFNFGLPDSFRTGQNSTDNCLSALVLSSLENSRFRSGEGDLPVTAGDVRPPQILDARGRAETVE